MDVRRRDLVDYLHGGVTQHAFGADVEQLDHALLVSGDDREVGAVEDRVLQGSCLQQCLFPSDLGDRFSRKAGIAGSHEYWGGHLGAPCTSRAASTASA